MIYRDEDSCCEHIQPPATLPWPHDQIQSKTAKNYNIYVLQSYPAGERKSFVATSESKRTTEILTEIYISGIFI
jgi:hypothetical protein